MRKMRLPLILLLTGALIVIGAFLPGIVSAVIDRTVMGKSENASMQSVQLEFSGETWEPDDMMKKLAVEQIMYTIPISAKDASMTEEEVYAAVEDCMEKYVSNGIFSWFEDTYRMTETYLAVSPDNMNIIWAVNIVRKDDPYQNLFLHLDDETGKILYLDYVSYDPDGAFYPEDQSYVLDAFAGIYFEQLGLTDLTDPDPYAQYPAAEEIQENDVWCRRYTFPDTEYGEIILEFYVKSTGFYISFPN